MDDTPEHGVRMGFNEWHQGPVDENSPDFDHWGCWCGNPECNKY